MTTPVSAPARRRTTNGSGPGRHELRGELLAALRAAFDGPAWHGPALRSALHGLAASDALRRLPGTENSIWELVLHLAYTRYILLGRLRESDGRRFPRPLAKGWWPKLPAVVGAEAWRKDQALLAEYHDRLEEAVRRVPMTRLATTRPGKRAPLHGEVAGVAAHDIYHTGQIRLIRRMLDTSR